MKPTDFVPKLAIQPAIFDADLVSFQVAYFLFLFLFSFSWQILLIITWLRANFMIYRRKREERKTNNKLSFRTRCFYDFCFMNSVNSLKQSYGQVCVCVCESRIHVYVFELSFIVAILAWLATLLGTRLINVSRIYLWTRKNGSLQLS